MQLHFLTNYCRLFIHKSKLYEKGCEIVNGNIALSKTAISSAHITEAARDKSI